MSWRSSYTSEVPTCPENRGNAVFGETAYSSSFFRATIIWDSGTITGYTHMPWANATYVKDFAIMGVRGEHMGLLAGESGRQYAERPDLCRRQHGQVITGDAPGEEVAAGSSRLFGKDARQHGDLKETEFNERRTKAFGQLPLATQPLVQLVLRDYSLF